MSGDVQFISQIVQLGLSGLIIYVILRPLIAWFMKRADEKDKYINDLVETHLRHDEQRHVLLMEALTSLPDKTSKSLMEMMNKVYPPEEYGTRIDEFRKKDN